MPNQNLRLAQSQNNGPVKVVEWLPGAFGGSGGWRIEGRAELLSREHFSGNYRFVEDAEWRRKPQSSS
jgi:hypothetical protein